MILEQTAENHPPLSTHNKMQKPTLVGEGLHVLNVQIDAAIRKQDRSFLINRVGREIATGAEALAINLGPGRIMAELTPWVVETIAGAVDVPLFLSAGITALDSVLEKYGPRITINAVTAHPDTLTEHLATAKRYGTHLVVLLVRPGMVPTGIDDRLQLASEVIGTAMDIGLPPKQLYLDPVITCRPDPQAWRISRGMPDIHPVLETIVTINELQMDIKTIVAMGNGTLGLSRQQKSAAQCRMLKLLTEAGAGAVILNCLDKSLMATANHLMQDTLSAVNDGFHHMLQ